MTIVNGGGLAVMRRWGTISSNIQYMNASGANNNTTNTGAAIEIYGGSRGATLHFLRVGRIWASPTTSIRLLVLVVRRQLFDVTAYQNVLNNRPDYSQTAAFNPYYNLGNDLLYSRILSLAAGDPAGAPSYNDPALKARFIVGYGPTIQAGEYMTAMVFPLHVPAFTGLVAELNVTLTARGGPIAHDTLISRDVGGDLDSTARSIPRGRMG